MKKRIISALVCIVMTIQCFPLVSFADYTDSDMGNTPYTSAEATWVMSYNPEDSDTSLSATPVTDKANFNVGNGKNAAVYKVKLPKLSAGIAIETAQFRMTSYYVPARAMLYAYKMPGEDWNMDTLTVGDAKKIIDGNSLGSGDNFLANCIEDDAFVESTNYRNRYDVTDYVNDAMEKGQEYVWIAVTRHNTIKAYPHDATSDKWRPKLFYTVKNSTVVDNPPTQSELEALLEETVKGGHPYLMGRKSDFDRVRSYINGDNSLVKEQYSRIKEIASAFLGTRVKEIANPSDGYMSIGFNSAWSIVPYCAFVYLMEGDEAYAQRAYDEAAYYASMESWGDYQYIDNTQSATAVAICYDWLYDWLSDEQKTELETALKEKHLDNVKIAYETDKITGIARHLRGEHNHAVMNNCTMFMQALAICDDDISYSAYIMSENLKTLRQPFNAIYPDSGWREGVGYWGFVGPMIARMMLSMKSAFGSCLGYENVSYVTNIAYFPIYAGSSEGSFIINDTNYVSPNTSFDKYILARLSGDKNLQKYSLGNDSLSHPFFCLAYDPDIDLSDATSDISQNDKHYTESGIVTMRSSWNNGQELFAAMAVQKANSSHGHMNSGTIGFDALGERWITNTGGEDYSVDRYFYHPDRWQYYAVRAEGNSCVVINPSEEGGQNPDSDDTIDTLVSAEGHSYAIADLTETYEGQVTSYKRGAGLFDNRRRFVLQDEMTLTEIGEVYSFINFYEADIEILNEGKEAVVSKNGKYLHVNINCNNPFSLEVMDSVPLPTSPNPEGQSSFPHLKKLVIKITDAQKVNLRVSMTPCLTQKELSNIKTNKFVPINEWSKTEDVPKPELENIYIDGIKLDDFQKDSRMISTSASISAGNLEIGIKESFGAEVEETDKGIEIFVFDKNDKANNYSYIIYPSQHEKLYAEAVRRITPTASEYVSTFSSDTSMGNQQFILFKLKLPDLADGESIKNALFKFCAGVYKGSLTADSIRFKMYGFNTDLASLSKLTYSDFESFINDENIFASPNVLTANRGLSSSCVYHLFESDVTSFANECLASGREYMYIGVSATNCNIKVYGTSVNSSYPDSLSSVSYEAVKNSSITDIDTINYRYADDDEAVLVSTPVITETTEGTKAFVRTVNSSDKPLALLLYTAKYAGTELTEVNETSFTAVHGDMTVWSDEALSGDGNSIKSFVWTLNLKPVTSSQY